MANKKSYTDIVKSTSILGGVQVFTVIISIIRTKIIAVLLGPEGVGLIGILQNTTDLFKNMITLGLPQSGVRNVAEAFAQKDTEKIAKTVKSLKFCLLFLGGLGAILMIVFSSFLSYLSFGNYEYEWMFICLSIAVLLTTIVNAQNVILQGSRKYVYLSKSTLYGSFIGLCLSVPFYFLWGLNGIVPSLIIAAFLSFLFSNHFSKKVFVEDTHITIPEAYQYGKSMLPLGISMMISSYMVVLASYILRAYITRKGGLTDVGMFQAAFSVTEVYFGMVFTAMATDYYPRLSGVSHDNAKVREEVDSQVEITYLIIAPLLVIFVSCSYLIASLLYSDEFVGIESYWVFASLGIFFKAYSFPLGFILFAKQKSKIFICTALIFNTLFLFNNIIGYNVSGITGLGISYALNYFVHLIGIYFIVRYIIGYKPNKVIGKVLTVCFLFNVLAILINQFIDDKVWYILICAIVIIASCAYSIYELNKRMSLLNKIRKRIG